MIPAWASEYVGIPWLEKGRDRAGLDCWGLVRLVIAERFGVALPSYADDYIDPSERDEIAGLLRGGIPENGWTPIDDAPRAGDGVVFRLLNQPWHVGVLVDVEHFLHVEHGVGNVCVERLDSYRWSRRRLGIFRHAALAETAR